MREIAALLGLAVAVLGWFFLATGKLDGAALGFFVVGGPGWLTYFVLTQLHAHGVNPFVWVRSADPVIEAAAYSPGSEARGVNPAQGDEGSPAVNASPALQDLMAQAVSAVSLKPDGRYTSPPSWGVYKIPASAGLRQFRTGNHPIRQRELERKYGRADVVGIFLDAATAQRVADLSNSTAR